MNALGASTNVIEHPVAIRDKELRQDAGLVVEIYEMCTLCGQRFGIGYRGSPASPAHHECETELPEKLKEILSKDHRQNRLHKCVIELDD